MPVGLGNAIRWLKYEISTISIDEAEADVSVPCSEMFRNESKMKFDNPNGQLT